MGHTDLSRIARKALRFVTSGEGCVCSETPVYGLNVWHSVGQTDSEPAIFEPRLYIVLQGAKSMTFARHHIELVAGDFAMSSVGVPFTTGVDDATPDTPYVGLGLALDSEIILSLLLAMPKQVQRDPPSIVSGKIEPNVLEPMERLLDLCSEPSSAPFLSPLVIREIHFRLLVGDASATVCQLANGGARFSQIKAAIDLLRGEESSLRSVDDLARAVGMSLTSFHRHFKAVTGYSPLLYQKHCRLIQARAKLMAREAGVTQTAYDLGYVSASQFSREYKKMFGASPRQDALSRSGQDASVS